MLRRAVTELMGKAVLARAVMAGRSPHQPCRPTAVVALPRPHGASPAGSCPMSSRRCRGWKGLCLLCTGRLSLAGFEPPGRGAACPGRSPGAGAVAWAGAGASTSAGAHGARVAESSLEKTLGLRREVPERPARVLCWKSLTRDARSPGEAASFPLGALSQSHRWPLATGHRGSARPGPAEQRCAQLQRPGAAPSLRAGPVGSTVRSWGTCARTGTLQGWEGADGTGLQWGRSRGLRVRLPPVPCREKSSRACCDHDSQNFLD